MSPGEELEINLMEGGDYMDEEQSENGTEKTEDASEDASEDGGLDNDEAFHENIVKEDAKL